MLKNHLSIEKDSLTLKAPMTASAAYWRTTDERWSRKMLHDR